MPCVIHQLPNGHEAYYPIELLDVIEEEVDCRKVKQEWSPFDDFFGGVNNEVKESGKVFEQKIQLFKHSTLYRRR